MGGKSRLVSTLVPIIEATPHDAYCEPFCGAAWVLFGKPPGVSKCEVINDADGELVRFFRVIQNHYLPFIDLYRHAVVSRQIFEWERMKRPETLTDLQRAARYYYLQRLAFGGKVAGRSFGYGTGERPRLDVDGISEKLTEVHRRLGGVVIERLDGLDCIRRYDRPGTLFFVDPPYCGTAGYAAEFPRERYAELAEVLKGIKGKFLFTINNHPHIREVFKDFRCAELKTRYTVARDKGRGAVRELLYSNFDWRAR